MSDAAKFELLRQHAPRVYFHTDETYFPSSVEWAFEHFRRELRDGKYCLRTKEDVICTVPTACACDNVKPPPALGGGNLTSAPIYAYWVEKKFETTAGLEIPFVDLVYFIFYPFNDGKADSGSEIGAHIGDWEEIVVRLRWRRDPHSAQEVLRPELVHMRYHGGGHTYLWGAVATTEGSHPIVYSAKGSHGTWRSRGSHHYYTWGAYNYHDHCNDGQQWKTWERVEAFDFNRKVGLAGSTWPLWMSDDFDDPGEGDPSDPASGAIYRWGNDEMKCGCAWPCALDEGPTGPVSKGVFSSAGLR